MAEDKDFEIDISNTPNIFSYPVKNFDSAINATLSNFMIGADDFWHNGFHLYTKEQIKNIFDGKVIAYRLTNEYKMYEIFKDITLTAETAKVYQIADSIKFQKYFDKDEKNQYVIKSNLSDEEKSDLYEYFGRVYSNNFILMEHTVKNLDSKEIKFYTLYNHLKPLQRMTVKQKMQLEWFSKHIIINSFPKYYYIQAYNILSKFGLKNPTPELEIPSETAYTQLPIKCIEWTMNGVKYQGYIDNKNIISWTANKYEIKTRNDSKNDSRYLKKEDLKQTDSNQFFIFDVNNRNTRNVIATCNSSLDYKISFNIIDFESYLSEEKKASKDSEIKGLKIFYNSNDYGYVFFTLEEINSMYDSLQIYKKKAGDLYKYTMENQVIYFNPKKGIKNKNDIIINKSFSMIDHSDFVEAICISKIVNGGIINYSDNIYIPCETKISYVKDQKYLCIQWVLNNNVYKGFVNSSDIRNDSFKEIKRPNNIYEDTNKATYLSRNSSSKKDKLLVYTTGSKSNRNVKGFTTEKDFIIEDFDSLINIFNKSESEIYKSGIKVRYNNSKDTGFIYFDWDSNENNSDILEVRKQSQTNVNKKINEIKNDFSIWISTVADKGQKQFNSLFKLQYEFSDAFELDKIVMPENLILKKDKVLGFAGYSFFKEDEKGNIDKTEIDNEDATSVHFEIFTNNIDFMKFQDNCRNYSCKLIAKKDCNIQKGHLIPVTHTKKINLEKNFDDKAKSGFRSLISNSLFKPSFISDELGESIENCLFEKKKTVTIANTNFIELKPKARIKTLGSDAYILRSDLEEWADTSDDGPGYYYVKNDKTVSLYNSKGIIQEDLSIELYAGYKYLWKETKNSVRRVKFIYEKISDTDSLFITEDTAKKLKSLYNECYVCDEDFSRITAEEILQEPKEQKWDGEKDAIQAGKTLKYLNKQCKDDNQIIWECVKAEDGTEFWINQNDISETDSTPVKKIIYDKWDKFFTEINLKKYGKYYCEKKEDFLKDFDLQLGKATTVSNVIKNNKELLLSKYYKKESEWLDSDEHTNALIDKYPMNKNAIMQERTDYEFWSGLNNKIPRECYFFNPRAFICHLDKVATPQEFNPYEGKPIEVANYMDPETGKNLGTKFFTVKTNPGFAPFIGEGKTVFSGYATCSQWFNEKPYLSSEYRHEGVDLVIDYHDCDKIPIKSFINGIVVASGDQGFNYYGNYLIIKATEKYNNKNKYYLLGHLSLKHEKLPEGSIVTPNTIVAYTGNTGHCYGQGYDMQGSTNVDKRAFGYGAHLHLQMYLSSDDDDKFLSKICINNGATILATRKGHTYVVNPFDYTEKRFLEK